MAEVIETTARGADVLRERELTAAHPHISWGAIFGGVFASLGLWLLLYVFGLAVGLSRLDPNDPGTLKSSGIFTGVWGLVAPLVALFVGGLVAGRASGVPSHGEGATHGFVMWGLTTVAGVAMVAMALAATVSGVASAGKAALQAGGGAIGAAAGAVGARGGASGVAETLGIDADEALRPINERLRAAGKPEVTAMQLQAAVRDAGQSVLREGRLDEDLLVSALARNTSLSRADAQEIADRLGAQIDRAKAEAADKLQGAQQTALEAAHQSGKAFWGVFGSLLLGLVAAVCGGALGVPRERTRVRREREIKRVPTASRPVGPPREVYP